MAEAQVSVGIRIGAPPAIRHERMVRAPGPGYVWVPGYWYAQGNRYKWENGYWTRPPYAGATWVQPRYEGGMFYAGYWNGNNGRFEHDHKWDKDKRNRDYDRDHDRDHDRH
jgi:hypothetical protein